MTVDDYIGRVTKPFAENGFYETELARTSEAFGQVVHVFSTYESRHAPGEAKQDLWIVQQIARRPRPTAASDRPTPIGVDTPESTSNSPESSSESSAAISSGARGVTGLEGS